MLKYTKEAINVIKDNLKLYAKIVKYGSLAFSLAFYIYSLITNTGNYIVNIILISLIVAFLAFETITLNKNIKKVKNVVYKAYKWIKLIIKAFTLGSMIYSIYLTSKNVNAITIILVTLTIVAFMMQLILEVLILIIQHNADYFLDAIKQDFEDMKKPVTGIKNVFRKMKGEETISPTPKSKKILKLEKRMEKLEEKKEKLNKKKYL